MATNMSKVLIFAFIAWIILKPLHKEVHDGDHVFAIIIIIIIKIIRMLIIIIIIITIVIIIIIIIIIIIVIIKVTIRVYYNGG